MSQHMIVDRPLGDVSLLAEFQELNPLDRALKLPGNSTIFRSGLLPSSHDVEDRALTG